MPAKPLPPTRITLAFLQCPNFPDGVTMEKVVKYRDSVKYHRRMLYHSMSGGRLHSAFGERFFHRIIWDNVQWRPDCLVVGLSGPDYEWIQTTIKKHLPSLILTFGAVAKDALIDVAPPIEMLHCHHPNARHKTQYDLDVFAETVKARMLQQ